MFFFKEKYVLKNFPGSFAFALSVFAFVDILITVLYVRMCR